MLLADPHRQQFTTHRNATLLADSPRSSATHSELHVATYLDGHAVDRHGLHLCLWLLEVKVAAEKTRAENRSGLKRVQTEKAGR